MVKQLKLQSRDDEADFYFLERNPLEIYSVYTLSLALRKRLRQQIDLTNLTALYICHRDIGVWWVVA